MKAEGAKVTPEECLDTGVKTGKCWCVRALGHPARLEDGTSVGAVGKELGGRGQGS